MAPTADHFLPAPHDHAVGFSGQGGELADGVGRFGVEAIEADGVAVEVAHTFVRSGRGPAGARRLVIATLLAWGYPDLVDDAAVITTELATNAVIHARTDFTVTIARLPGNTIRVSVRDASRKPPQPREPMPLEGSGRGLRLVEAIAGIWGTDLVTDGKVVWAQLQPTG